MTHTAWGLAYEAAVCIETSFARASAAWQDKKMLAQSVGLELTELWPMTYQHWIQQQVWNCQIFVKKYINICVYLFFSLFIYMYLFAYVFIDFLFVYLCICLFIYVFVEIL